MISRPKCKKICKKIEKSQKKLKNASERVKKAVFGGFRWGAGRPGGRLCGVGGHQTTNKVNKVK